eukprot:jgi/Hompol1/5770/HPOL_004682-RA
MLDEIDRCLANPSVFKHSVALIQTFALVAARHWGLCQPLIHRHQHAILSILSSNNQALEDAAMLLVLAILQHATPETTTDQPIVSAAAPTEAHVLSIQAVWDLVHTKLMHTADSSDLRFSILTVIMRNRLIKEDKLIEDYTGFLDSALSHSDRLGGSAELEYHSAAAGAMLYEANLSVMRQHLAIRHGFQLDHVTVQHSVSIESVIAQVSASNSPSQKASAHTSSSAPSNNIQETQLQPLFALLAEFVQHATPTAIKASPVKRPKSSLRAQSAILIIILYVIRSLCQHLSVSAMFEISQYGTVLNDRTLFHSVQLQFICVVFQSLIGSAQATEILGEIHEYTKSMIVDQQCSSLTMLRHETIVWLLTFSGTFDKQVLLDLMHAIVSGLTAGSQKDSEMYHIFCIEALAAMLPAIVRRCQDANGTRDRDFSKRASVYLEHTVGFVLKRHRAGTLSEHVKPSFSRLNLAIMQCDPDSTLLPNHSAGMILVGLLKNSGFALRMAWAIETAPRVMGTIDTSDHHNIIQDVVNQLPKEVEDASDLISVCAIYTSILITSRGNSAIAVIQAILDLATPTNAQSGPNHLPLVADILEQIAKHFGFARSEQMVVALQRHLVARVADRHMFFESLTKTRPWLDSAPENSNHAVEPANNTNISQALNALVEFSNSVRFKSVCDFFNPSRMHKIMQKMHTELDENKFWFERRRILANSYRVMIILADIHLAHPYIFRSTTQTLLKYLSHEATFGVCCSLIAYLADITIACNAMSNLVSNLVQICASLGRAGVEFHRRAAAASASAASQSSQHPRGIPDCLAVSEFATLPAFSSVTASTAFFTEAANSTVALIERLFDLVQPHSPETVHIAFFSLDADCSLFEPLAAKYRPSDVAFGVVRKALLDHDLQSPAPLRYLQQLLDRPECSQWLSSSNDQLQPALFAKLNQIVRRGVANRPESLLPSSMRIEAAKCLGKLSVIVPSRQFTVDALSNNSMHATQLPLLSKPAKANSEPCDEHDLIIQHLIVALFDSQLNIVHTASKTLTVVASTEQGLAACQRLSEQIHSTIDIFIPKHLGRVSASTLSFTVPQGSYHPLTAAENDCDDIGFGSIFLVNNRTPTEWSVQVANTLLASFPFTLPFSHLGRMFELGPDFADAILPYLVLVPLLSEINGTMTPTSEGATSIALTATPALATASNGTSASHRLTRRNSTPAMFSQPTPIRDMFSKHFASFFKKATAADSFAILRLLNVLHMTDADDTFLCLCAIFDGVRGWGGGYFLGEIVSES